MSFLGKEYNKELCKKDDVVYKFEDGVKWYADLKNIGSHGNGGSAKGAAFIQYTKWK